MFCFIFSSLPFPFCPFLSALSPFSISFCISLSVPLSLTNHRRPQALWETGSWDAEAETAQIRLNRYSFQCLLWAWSGEASPFLLTTSTGPVAVLVSAGSTQSSWSAVAFMASKAGGLCLCLGFSPLSTPPSRDPGFFINVLGWTQVRLMLHLLLPADLWHPVILPLASALGPGIETCSSVVPLGVRGGGRW